MADPLTHSHDTATPALSVESEYVLVPREPTLRMVEIGDKVVDWCKTFTMDGETDPARVWRAMWDAATPAPSPSPAAKGGETLREVAKGYEALEADIILSADWSASTPRLTQAQWDEVLRLQHLRNAALATPSPQPANAVREALRTNIEAFLDMHRKGVLVPPTPFIPIELLQKSLAALASDPAPAGEAVDTEQLYLIRKGGGFYRPNSQGYTRSIAEAGRYTLAEAEAITHPNGPEGPRDGMDYVPAGEAAEQDDLTAAYMAGVERGREDTARLREDLERVTEYARAATVAITSLTAGGSEYFGKRIGDLYTADLPFCLDRIRSSRTAMNDALNAAIKGHQAAERERDDARKALESFTEALTPSGGTKAEYIGEFFEEVEFPNPEYDEDDEDSDDGETILRRVPVQWETVKQIMNAIKVRAARSVSREGASDE